jgi:hypothetical protein
VSKSFRREKNYEKKKPDKSSRKERNEVKRAIRDYQSKFEIKKDASQSND